MKIRFFPAFACLTLLAGSAVGQSWTAVFSDTNGNPSSTTIVPGDSFSFRFDLQMTGGATGNALDYYLAVVGNEGAGSGKFTLSQRDRSGSLFNDVNASDAAVVGLLNPTSALSLGASTNPFQDVTGTQFIANYTFATAADLMPGDYSIVIDSNRPVAFWSVSDEKFDTQPIYSSYNVTVLPEPASIGGLAMLAGVLIRRVRP